MEKVNKYPKVCNLCGAKVVYVTNDKIYGSRYGSGYAYMCTGCGAYVGTHKPRPREALGILANKEMREMKMKCHAIFDKMWSTRKERLALYERLSIELDIPLMLCHFGYFNLDQLYKAYKVVKSWGSEATAEEIKAEIEDLKYRRFLEEMADYMDWGAYRELTRKINELELELKALESEV